MACYNPIRANLIKYCGGQVVQLSPFDWIEGRRETGVFIWHLPDGTPVQAYESLGILLPCGKCDGCLIERSRQWAARCMNELKQYDKSCFLTLTYNEQNIPSGNTLVRKHLQDFIKRLRRKIEPQKIRYFGCGEYGSLGLRPHYHLIIFGWSPDDLEIKVTNDKAIKSSKTLSQLWKFGFHSVGKVTFESCAYVARYVMKKLHKNDLGDRLPEFICMSTRPGISKLYFDDYGYEISKNGYQFTQGRQVSVPRYCDKILRQKDGKKYNEIKEERQRKIKPYNPEEIAKKRAFTAYLQSKKTDKKI